MRALTTSILIACVAAACADEAATGDETAPLDDITLWHAWGEVHGKAGRFRFGRMPLHWGSGLWLNDGLGEYGEYGDSADRVAWEYLIQDTVYLMAAFDVNAENFVNESDDTTSYNLAAAYRSEQVVAGLLAQYRRVPDPKFNLFTIYLTGPTSV